MPLSFFTPGYRFRIWCFRNVRRKDFLQLVMAMATGGLAISTYSLHPERVLILGGVYFFALLLLYGDTLRSRGAKDRVQAEVLWGLFSHMNKEIFHDDNTTRFTLFIPSPLRSDYLVPWYRYRKGGQDPIAEALKSKARYRRGEGFTGQAWENAGNDLFCGSFPVFGSRNDFDKYYISELEIEPDTVRELSDFMVSIRTIFTYGFTETTGKLLGVLSLDMQRPLEGTNGDDTFRTNPAELNTHDMALIVRSIKSVLESFYTTQRR